MSPRLVYVAAPLAPWKAQGPDAAGYIVAIEQFEHVKRANKIARAALEAGYAPILVHNDVRAGVFGSDDVDADRERGLRACVATGEAVARAGGELWLLLLPDGTASHGCHTERAAFSRAGGRGIRLWRLVRFGADEHETPVCVGTVGIYGPNVVTRGRPEAARMGALPERVRDAVAPPLTFENTYVHGSCSVSPFRVAAPDTAPCVHCAGKGAVLDSYNEGTRTTVYAICSACRGSGATFETR